MRNNFRKLKYLNILIKTVIYRAFIILVQTVFTFYYVNAMTKMNYLDALNMSIVWNVVNVILYFLYECYFAKTLRISEDDGFVLWATGIPCSGKSTLLDAVAKELRKKDRRIERLDGDIVRTHLSKDLGFSAQDRKTNLERVTFVAKLLSRNGTGVLCSFVSPYRNDRQVIRDSTCNFIELYVYADKTVCAKRDVKGMWKKAQQGKIKGFTGYDAPYESPYDPEILCNTANETVEESVKKVINYLTKRGLI